MHWLCRRRLLLLLLLCRWCRLLELRWLPNHRRLLCRQLLLVLRWLLLLHCLLLRHRRHCWLLLLRRLHALPQRLCHPGHQVCQKCHVNLTQQLLLQGRVRRPVGRQQGGQLLQVAQRGLQPLRSGGGGRAQHLEHAANEGILQQQAETGVAAGQQCQQQRC